MKRGGSCVVTVTPGAQLCWSHTTVLAEHGDGWDEALETRAVRPGLSSIDNSLMDPDSQLLCLATEVPWPVAFFPGYSRRPPFPFLHSLPFPLLPDQASYLRVPGKPGNQSRLWSEPGLG